MGAQSPSLNEEEEELDEEQRCERRKVQTEYMEALVLGKRRPGPQKTDTDEVCMG